MDGNQTKAEIYDENGNQLESYNVSEDGDNVLQLTPYSQAHLLATSIILGSMILATIIGNVFVIAAIILEKNLHNVANYLMLSLAVADLLVAALVMPLAAVNEVSREWFLGAEICDMWISFDVLCCTSSILHLVCIALDRYWAVTRVDYIANRSGARIILMLVLCWVISVCISIPPLFGWKDTNDDPNISGDCIISQDWGYTVYSTVGAFYLPLVFIMIIYLKIFSAAKSRIRKKNFRSYQSPNELKLPTISHDTNSHEASTLLTQVSNGNAPNNDSSSNKLLVQQSSNLSPPPSPQVNHKTSLLDITKVYFRDRGNSPKKKEKEKKEKLEAKRERKAARTLAIITGTFIGCWLPFFIVAIVRPFCGSHCQYPPVLMSIIGWLGYFNSLLNPIIYTIFNPDFRMAFHKILFGKYHGRRR